MSLRRGLSKLGALFRRLKPADDIEEEIRAHLEMEKRENLEAGMVPEEAYYAALRRFGNVPLTQERSREMWTWTSLETLGQDFRYGLRMLRKDLGFTAVAVLTLALGIGANTAIFSLGNVFMFRPLPVKDAERLAVVAVQYHADADPGQLSYPDYQDFRNQSNVFTDMTFFDLSVSGISYQGHANRIIMAYVPSNFFSMLGIRPALGRLIAPGEGDAPKTGPVVVLGHSYWMRHFGSDPGIIGRSVTLDGQAVTVIGVVPKEFNGPYNLIELDAYAPIGIHDTPTHSGFYQDRGETELRVLATLKPGITTKQAEASLNVIAERLAKAYPKTNKGQMVRVVPERLARPEPAVESYMPLVTTIFLIMVGLVLLVACFNVANLQLARAASREKEIAVRAAMGAGRARLIRQMITESLVLAVAGAVGGALVGNWVIRGLEKLRPLGDFSLRLGFSFDWRVFAYVAGIALLAGIVSGLAPALRASRTNLNETLREGGRGLVGDTRRHWLRNGLVVAQVAGSLIVLVAAGLFTRSLRNAEAVDLGYDPHHVLNMSLDPSLQGYNQKQSEAFFRELLPRVRALPGVQSVSLAFSVPLGYYGDGTAVYPEGQERESTDKRAPGAGYNCVTPDYFTTLRMKILEGRAFTESDTSTTPLVAVVNQAMADQLWPHQDAVGRRFSYKGAQGPFGSARKDDEDSLVTVVGVVRNARVQGLLDAPGNFFYVPQTQNYKATHVLHLRTSVPPQLLRAPVEALVRELEPNLPIYDVMTMEQTVDGANGYFLFKVGAGFAASLGILGLILAVVGVYGVVSYGASQRQHEIGIRMALGARPAGVLGLIIRQAAILVGAGIGVGVLAALGINRLLLSLLVGVTSSDPLTLVSVCGLMLAVALLACYIPARRATKVDPLAALRHE
ncbi:MAG: ABC transporter permease [Terriglobia bacterium]|jgi:putative ABC transport system permease protein